MPEVRQEFDAIQASLKHSGLHWESAFPIREPADPQRARAARRTELRAVWLAWISTRLHRQEQCKVLRRVGHWSVGGKLMQEAVGKGF